MSQEKARRWTLYASACGPAWDGPGLERGGERVEVAEVSKLREEWERDLLSDRAKRAALEAFGVTRMDSGVVSPAVIAAVEAALAATKSAEQGGKDA